jgi:hypothetical protein
MRTATKVNQTKQVAALLGLLAAAACASGCGGVTDSRMSARDKATKATCNRYQQCGLIGPNADDAYVTYDSCSTVWSSNWEQDWPATTCTSINQSGLNVCLNAIAATDCTSVADFFLTLGKCEAQDVCVGGAADAGTGS